MILIQKNNDTSTVEPIVLQNTGVSSPKKLNLNQIDLHSAESVIDEKDLGDTKIYGSATEINNAPVTSDSSLALDSTDKIYIPDVEFKSGSLEAVLNSIGQPQSEKSINVTNGNMQSSGSYNKIYQGQDVNPTAIVARGKLVSSPIIGIEVAEKAEDTSDNPWEKELYLGVTRLDTVRKEVTNKRIRITRNEEIYRVKDQVTNLLSTIPDVSKRGYDASNHVFVEVHTENGSLKSVDVSTKDIASDKELKEVSANVDAHIATYNDFIANKWNKQMQNVSIKDPYKNYITVNVERDASGKIITGTLDHSYVHVTYSSGEGTGQKGIVVDSEIPRLIDTSIKEVSTYAEKIVDNLKVFTLEQVELINEKFGKNDASLDAIFDVSHVHVAINASSADSFVSFNIPKNGNNLSATGTVSIKYAEYNTNGSVKNSGLINNTNIQNVTSHINSSISDMKLQINSLFENDSNFSNTIENTLKPDIATNRTNIANNAAEIAALKSSRDTQKDQITTLIGRADVVDGSIGKINTSLALLDDWISDVNAHEATCDEQFPQINSSITTLKTSSHAHSTITGKDSKEFIKTTINQAGANLNSVMAINTTYHTYDSDTDGIVTWTGDLKEYVKCINSSLDSHAGTIGNHTTWLTNTSTYVQNVSMRLANAQGDINGNANDIERILAYIQDLSNRLNTTNTNISNVDTRVANVSNYAQNVSSRLNSLNTTVTNHNTWLGNVSTAIANVSARVSVCETRLNDLSTYTYTLKSCTCSGDAASSSDITELRTLINNVSTYAHSITPGSSYNDSEVRGLINDLSTFAHSIKSCTCSDPTPAEYTPVFLSLS